MDRRFVRLPDAAFRAFMLAMMWSVSNRTDGRIEHDDVVLIPGFNPTAIPVLCSCGLWEESSTGYTIVEYHATQTSKSEFEVLENARRADREKKRKQRATKKDPVSPGDAPRDLSPGTAQARQGKARQEQAGTISPLQKPSEMSWLTADIPGSERKSA